MKLFRVSFPSVETLRQYGAAITMNIAALASTIFASWSTPMIPLLLKDTNPVGNGPMTEDEISWISSIGALAPVISVPFCAWSTERFGRKITGSLTSVPIIIGWLLTLFAQNVWYLLIARLLAGVSCVISYTVTPVYVNEIADDSNRGQLGSFLGFSCNMGILIAYIFGATLSYQDFAICGIVLAVIFIATFSFMPETPSYLIRKGRDDKAERSMMWFKNNDTAVVDRELVQLKKSLKELTDPNKKSVHLRDLFRNRQAVKAFVTSLGLFTGQQITGYSIVIIYTAIIFELANSSLRPNEAAIIVAVIQIIGSWLSTMVMDRMGARLLILLSCVAMMACHVIFGIFFLLQSQNIDLSSFAWLPIVALSGYAIAFCIGLGPGIFVVSAQVFDPDVANLGISVNVLIVSFISFGTIKLFPFISSEYGSHVSFFILAAGCAITFVFSYVLVPDSKRQVTKDEDSRDEPNINSSDKRCIKATSQV